MLHSPMYAAYKKFKKYQCLHEKEKLKHERYTLKESIEQLCALEPSHIANLFFIMSSPCAPPDEDRIEHDTPQPNRNMQSQPHSNGKWHNHQILAVVSSLEVHYHTLLNTCTSSTTHQNNQCLHYQCHQCLHQPLHLPKVLGG